MPDEFSDDKIAEILSKEAKETSIKYSAHGMSAFLPSKYVISPRALSLANVMDRPPANKPKPNTRFLRNLVRDTDSHNAALLAKEAAESRNRLEQLVTKDTRRANDIRRRQLGSITAVLNGNAPKRQRIGGAARPGRDDGASSGSLDGGKDRSADTEECRQDKGRRPRKFTDDEDMKDVSSSKDRHRPHRSEPKRLSHHEKHRSRHRSRSRSPDKDRRSRDPKRRERSPGRRSLGSSSSRREDKSYDRERSRRNPSPQPGSDSDPLEAIVGPLPPPKVKSRGRGTVSSTSGIDARFSESYDPALDLVPESQENDDNGDDWELVLDRVKWKQQGADRLKAAGFTEEEIEGWKSGKKAEVKWTASGKEREWDRGKPLGGVDGGAE
ncbi:hypothetical protein V492_05198 [Pseudogymnoascus sp. VKM F-4246]|nr:hypothetical protein V492_05198 [Pseudogymnoascus sp. VKM F-4246]